jgi:hypothetical protein
MRFLVSGGMRFSHSGFGTTPNMAPPSSCWTPASMAWMRIRPTCVVRLSGSWGSWSIIGVFRVCLSCVHATHTPEGRESIAPGRIASADDAASGTTRA